MPKPTTLSLVEDADQVVESTASVVEEEDAQPVQEDAAAAAPTQDVHALAQQVARLEAYAQIVEGRLQQLESKAHTDHQIEIGPNELAAIAHALNPHTQQTIIDHLKEHLGIAPPAVKGS